MASNNLKILKVEDPATKSGVCNSILRGLPQWFGIESAIVNYVKDVEAMETWIAYDKSEAMGFVSINRHFAKSAEVHVMGIAEKYHRKGIGQQLLAVVEAELRKSEVQFLSVKTLSPSRPDKGYDQTRQFYLKMGFTPLEEFKTLWNEDNPCLLLVKVL